jgi:uncharacterized protein
MPMLTFETTIQAPLEEVWAFHDHPDNLARLSPAELEVQVESADVPIREGSRVAVSMRSPISGRTRWTARVVEHRPPHAVVFGMEARFVDEQEDGPMKRWRHEHDFEAIDSKTTRLIDRVTYQLPLGPIGWLVDVLLIRRRVGRMFRYRHAVTRDRLELEMRKEKA